MLFEELTIPGCWKIIPEPLNDFRGSFTRVYCGVEFRNHGLPDCFVQQNQTHTRRRGTIRGLHLQLAPFAEAKHFRCIRGAVYDVAVDLRSGSDSFCQSLGLVLSEENGFSVLIPEGCAHGFQALTDDCVVSYQSSAAYSPDHERQVSFSDPRFDIAWPVTEIIASEKDRSAAWLPEDFRGYDFP